MRHYLQRLRVWGLQKLAGQDGVAINLRFDGVQIELRPDLGLLVVDCVVRLGLDYDASVRVLRPGELATEFAKHEETHT